jgi:membrane fusion protein (multidrug efflux system)
MNTSLRSFACIFHVFLLSSIGCGEKAGAGKEKLESFPVVRPTYIDTVFDREHIAEISSQQNIEIRTRIKGFIEKIHVDEGKPVSEGQLLFTLGSRMYREDLMRATANHKSAFADLKVAEVELKNTQTLADKRIVSVSELEMARARKEAAQARVEEALAAIGIARLNLSYTQVRAPYSGIINRIPNKTGSVVEEGTLLTTLSNNREMFAYFNISEREFIEVMKRDSLGDMAEVSLVLANNESFPYKGRIETAESEIDRGTGNIAFRARFKNPEQVLRHGASGKILLREELKQALVIPQKATFEIQDKTFVFVVDSTGRVRTRNIATRLRLPHLYVVQSGLGPDDRVVLEGIQVLKEGMKVQPKELSLKDARID